MTALRVWITRLVGTLTGRRREDELREELETHLELLADEHRRRGLSDAEARLVARRELGGIDRTREAFRDTRRLPGVDALAQDVRFAWRGLRRERGTTLAAIALLTVGVSSTVVLADVVDRLLLRPPTHVDDPARVRRVYDAWATGDGRPGRMVSNYVTLERLAAGTRDDLEWIAPYMNERIGSGHGTRATRLEAIAFGPAYFDVLGITPRLGVLPSARRAADETAVVISHALWQQRFGGSDSVIGQPLALGQRTYTIAAVAPRGFAGVDEDPVDVWVPLAARMTSPDWRTSEGYYLLRALARLRPGVDRERAEAHVSQVYNAVHSIQMDDGRRRAYRVVLGELLPGQEPAHSTQTEVLLAVGAVSVLVLLIACGNVGNLLILAGMRRASELSMKVALGATRGRLLREIFIQAALLALAAAAGSLVVVLVAGGLVRGVFLPPLAALAAPVDGRLVTLAIAISASAALVLGLAPALRLSSVRLVAPGHRARHVPSRVIDAFVALQVAFSVPLLVGTGLFVASVWQASRVDFGTETSHVSVLAADLADDGRPAEAHAAHRAIQRRLLTLPGVTGASLAQSIPGVRGYAAGVLVPGFTGNPSGAAPMFNAVDPSYRDVLGLRVVEGRWITDADNRPNARPVAIVNEAMARKYWAGQSPIGRCIHVNPDGKPPMCTEVVGVVAKASWYQWLGSEPYGDQHQVLTLPIERFGDLNASRGIVVRTSAPPRAVLGQLQREAQAAAPGLPYVDAFAFDDTVDFQYRPLRLGAWVFLALSALALIIAIAGLAVVTAHGVTRRTREMGIRLVLGAEPGELVRLMARRTILAMTIGLAAGAALAFAGARLLRSVLFGIEPGDPRVFVSAVVVLFVIGGVAAYIPARRTGRIDPSAALRIE